MKLEFIDSIDKNIYIFDDLTQNVSNLSDNLSMITIKIELDKKEYRASDREILTYTLINNSKDPVNVLKWHTPFEGIEDNIFKVTRQGQEAVYLGIIKKRGLPIPEDYVSINANESISTKIDLTEFYDISQSGRYHINYESTLLDFGTNTVEKLISNLKETKMFDTQTIRSNMIEFNLLENREPKQVNGVVIEFIEKLESSKQYRGVFSTNCSPDQLNTINNAQVEAENYASESVTTLLNTPLDTVLMILIFL